MSDNSSKILMLHSSSDMYGASKIFLLTVEALKREGHHLIVVLSEEGALVKEIEKLEIPVYFLNLGILRKKYFNPVGIFLRMFVIAKCWLKLLRLCRKLNVKTIYSNTSGVLVGGLVAKSLSIRHIFHIHEIIKEPKWFATLLFRLIHYFSSVIVVVSKAVEESIRQFTNSGKVIVVHNGIEYDEYIMGSSSLRQELQIKDDTLVIGMIARVHYWKGQEYFLDLAKEIYKHQSNVRFVMVGDAFPGYEYLYENIKNKISQNGLEKVVTDLGYRTDINNILHGLDIFILPSILPDPFPTTILEAMAAGKLIAATDHGGAKEMIQHQKSGILIPSDNAVVSYERIKPFLLDPKLRRTFGNNARERALHKFSKENYERAILSIFESA